VRLSCWRLSDVLLPPLLAWLVMVSRCTKSNICTSDAAWRNTAAATGHFTSYMTQHVQTGELIDSGTVCCLLSAVLHAGGLPAKATMLCCDFDSGWGVFLTGTWRRRC
jgi:hypothetical protein